MLLLLALFACKPDDAPAPFEFPDPTDAPELRGPGGPAVPFAEEDLWIPCAELPGGPEDWKHHNLVMPYRGHLVLPWAAEWGDGGLSFFEVDDPCAPVKISDSFERTMRETHAIGFVHLPEGDDHAGDYAAVNHQKGVMIWDVSDPAAPVVASILEIEGVFWPDAYSHVVLSVSWQYPYLYAGASDNGIYVIDARDPYAPVLLTHHVFDPGIRVGGVFAFGTRLFASGAEQSHAVIVDIGVPDELKDIPGGRFEVTDDAGDPKEMYHSNLIGDVALFTRKEGAGGFVMYDVSDPTAPTRLGDFPNTHNGGYVFWHEGYAFVGDSDIAAVYDARDPGAIALVGEADLEGDLDTNVPYGNVMALSVDDEAGELGATVLVPWSTEVDTVAPRVRAVDPPDGAVGVPTTARIGIAFDEIVEPSTAFAGSIRLWDAEGSAVDGWATAQDVLASYAPKEPLKPSTTYTLEILADGVRDVNGNPVDEPVTTTFTTAAQ